jgi:hypothetical protein
MGAIVMYLNSEQHGQMVFHILQQGYHKPLIDGKANRDEIEEQITIGLYAGEIPACNQEDVDWICDLVDCMIQEYGKGAEDVPRH